MGDVVRVVIPYAPRVLQKELHALVASHRFTVAVCHRRFGKTVASLNQLQKSALTCRKDRPRLAYIAPTYKQGKAVAWDYMKHYAQAIPGVQANEVELRVDYPNGGQIRIYGADNPDSLRGIYLDGAVLDEYGLQPHGIFSEVIRPALADRGGWALFIGTPNGHNQFYEIAELAKTEPGWAFAEYKASVTKILPIEELEAARAVMTPDEYAQEFECSFEASVKGAIYATELAAAKESGRITQVPVDPALPVNTHWDLGIGDATAIWFEQRLATQVRLVDYYEASGEGLPHYAKVLQARGYVYGKHYAPHDIAVRELGTGRSRQEVALAHGIRFERTPNIDLEDGIHAARMLFPRCWFDREKCKAGLEALGAYRRDYNQRLEEFKATPVHDWSEHGASAFRYLAVNHKDVVAKPVRESGRRAYPQGAGGWMV